MPRTDGKKTGERTRERSLISIDNNGSKKVEVNSFDEDAFFTF